MKPLASSAHATFLLGLFSDPEGVPQKRRLVFNGLYYIKSQEIELFKEACASHCGT
jgi:hypothetical protein